MGAPNDAYVIGPFKPKDGKPSERGPRIVCVNCKWKGHLDEMLGVDDEDTLWCPKCRMADWVYA